MYKSDHAVFVFVSLISLSVIFCGFNNVVTNSDISFYFHFLWLDNFPAWAFLVTWMAKNLLAMKGTQVSSLGWEDPLKEMATTSVFLPREFYGQRSLAGYSPWGHKE